MLIEALWPGHWGIDAPAELGLLAGGWPDLSPTRVHLTVKIVDALIAATAIEHGLPVVTKDDDYDQVVKHRLSDTATA